MSMLSIREVLLYEFEKNRYYSLKDIFSKFAQYYNINIEEFTFVGYSYNEVVDIVKDNNIGKIEDENILLLSKDIWELFLNICDKIELDDKKEKLSEEQYQEVFNENIRNVSKVLINGMKDKSRIHIDVFILQKILDEIFSDVGYIYSDRGKENLEVFLKFYSAGYDKNKSKFIIEVNNIENIINDLYKYIDVWKEEYYSISDIKKRLKYPANLDNYYINSPWIYYGEYEWIDYSMSGIQEIVRKDYEGESEFFKFGSWKIYGSDERYKDKKGKHEIPRKRSSEIRPEGYELNKGKLQYLMNSTYCTYLIIELERRILNVNYKYALTELEDKIKELSNTEIMDYSSGILVDINKYYMDNITFILDSNKIRIQEYRDIIDRIQKYRKQNTLRALKGYKELKTAVNKLEKIKYIIPTEEDILTNISTILEKSCKDNIKNIARKLYNKQIRNDKNFKKFRLKSYSLQGEGSKKAEEIKGDLKEFRKTLKQKKLIQFDLYFKDMLDV